jgi:hypothetical protein
MAEYERQTGKKADLFEGSSDGAWHVGTALVAPGRETDRAGPN